jgi:outer membrane protein assembly factor BamB
MFESTVDFDPTSSVASSLTSAGGRDGYIAKYNTTTGELLWTRRVGGTQKDELDGLTVSAQGAFATGKFQGTSDFDPDTAVASFTAVGGDDVCVVHLNASGNYVWAESLGSSDEDFAYATALDPAGDLYVTGFYSGAAAYSSGGAVLAHYGSEDMFLAKFSGSTGAIQWTEGLGDSATDERAIGLHVTNDYDIFVTGIYGGTVDFDPDSSATAPLTATDYQDGFVLKLTQPLLSTTSLASTSAALVAAVFPNPSTGSFTVELEQAYESLDVAVYSNTGQRLQEQHYNGQTVLQLHLPYAAGTYFVQLRTASGTSQVVAVQKR